MADSKKMKPLSNVDLQNLSDVQKMYIKRVERINKKRANLHIEERGLKRYFLGGLGLVVLGTYLYTMYAVKQERLGDEFDQRYSEQETEK